MAISTQHSRRAYRIAIALGVVALLVAAGLVGAATQPAGATADVAVSELSIPDTNRTTAGDVSDVRVSVALDYDYSVPDATRRIVKLKAGRSTDDLETLTFDHAEVAGSGNGTATLDASLLDHSALSRGNFQPMVANEMQQAIVVQAVLEVRRENGEPIMATATEPVTVTVRDGTKLSATIAGSGSVDIVTDA